ARLGLRRARRPAAGPGHVGRPAGRPGAALPGRRATGGPRPQL
ncbi:MAG: Carbonic anhydrase, beta class, partial [uncultured Ramlibacter sp.]